MYDDGDAELAWCPKCGRPVYEEAQKCPHCGEWITPTLRNPRGGCLKRLFMLAIVGLLIYALLRVFWP